MQCLCLTQNRTLGPKPHFLYKRQACIQQRAHVSATLKDNIQRDNCQQNTAVKDMGQICWQAVD